MWNLDIRGDELLSTSADGSVKLWNVGSAEVKASHENEKLGIPISAQFTPDEGKIVTGWTGEKLTVVDLETVALDQHTMSLSFLILYHGSKNISVVKKCRENNCCLRQNFGGFRRLYRR